MLRLQIEATDQVLNLDGVPVRVWKGTTPDGHPCDVLVHRIGALDDSPADIEIGRKLPPAPMPILIAGVLPRDTAGPELVDEETGLPCKYCTAGPLNGWILSRDPDAGGWVPLRRATPDDVQAIYHQTARRLIERHASKGPAEQ